VRRSWNRLIKGQCGIRSLGDDERFNKLPSRIAGTVPLGNKEQGGWAAKEWLRAGDERTMALFSQYAMAAATEALDDAGWNPTAEDDLESTVCFYLLAVTRQASHSVLGSVHWIWNR
jgi:3-oxoacyl-[acyl-carrier-protein] synthase II